MTPDIKGLVERLRGFAARHYNAERVQMASDAADTLEAMAGEVERVSALLRASRADEAQHIRERDRLKAALQQIASQRSFAELEAGTEDDDVDYDLIGAWDIVIDVARKALGNA